MAKWIDEERYTKIKNLFVSHYDTFYYIENNIASTVSESTTEGTSNNTTTNDENPPKDKIKW